MSDTSDLRALTEAYIAAFDACDLEKIEPLLDETMTLTDPEVRGLTPRSEVLSFMASLFESAGGDLSFKARRIFVDGAISIIEFDLKIGDAQLEGVDVIEWRDGRILTMNAYVNPVPAS